jgi:acyl carrier protein
MTTNQEILDVVKTFILTEFLPGEEPSAFTETTPLVSGGILDSLATLRLVSFVEEQYNIQLEPHELVAENLETLTLIAELIAGKL